VNPNLTPQSQGPAPYPVCVGHEIVGTAVRVGSKAEGGIKVGDRVGVGAQSDSCLGRRGHQCEECSNGEENYCATQVITYGAFHFNGGKAMGGHATYNRSPSHFVFKIPNGLESAAAAPMLCGGATVYSPLTFFGAGPGKKVGILGVGGLGHFGVLFAKALGAKVVGLSRRSDKKEDILKMGADEYIAMEEDEDWLKKNEKTFDLIINTISSTKVRVSPTHRCTRHTEMQSY
jgi:alcohol dehydrogenase (NADP+)